MANKPRPSNEIRADILHLVEEYYGSEFGTDEFVPGESPVPYAGRVFDSSELLTLTESSLDFWLTTGRFAARFEREFSRYLGTRHTILCNSGSSANLLAISSLTSASLEDRQLHPGDEVITVAAGFPTTVAPMFQNQLVPVFLDIDIGTYNVDVSQMEDALSPKTKAIVLAHSLGNPFNLDFVTSFAKKNNLWLIEDNCDALGATYNGQKTGTFGAFSTTSFYPAHQITMGEGGSVSTNEPSLKVIVESFRDWGRDCWCEPGDNDTCGKRYDWQLGDLPLGYDHKFIYSHIGYNLKATDMQAAVGVSQLRKLPDFVDARRSNWQFYFEALKDLEDYFILPEATPNSEPSWFGFALTVRPNAPFTRREFAQHLDGANIATRMLFSGNLIRHPAYKDQEYRAIGDLSNTDQVMNDTIWIGVYPGLSSAMLDYVVSTIREFVTR